MLYIGLTSLHLSPLGQICPRKKVCMSMRLKSKVGREFEGQVNIFCNAAGYNNHFIYNLSLNSVHFKHKDNTVLRYIHDMLVDF